MQTAPAWPAKPQPPSAVQPLALQEMVGHREWPTSLEPSPHTGLRVDVTGNIRPSLREQSPPSVVVAPWGDRVPPQSHAKQWVRTGASYDAQCTGRQMRHMIGFASQLWDRHGPGCEPEATICVQDVDVQCVLQFTLSNTVGCTLYQHMSLVIHCLELFQHFRELRPGSTTGRYLCLSSRGMAADPLSLGRTACHHGTVL